MILKNLRDDSCFVDVGANIGFYICIVSKFLKKGIVYSFEMDELAYKLLNDNIELNKNENVKSVNCAVSDNDSCETFVRDSNEPNAGLQLSVGEKDCEDCVRVDAITLDKFFSDKKKSPDVMKIDVEGAELKVLKGMRRMICEKRVKLFIEVHCEKLLDFGDDYKKVLGFLIDNGYKIYAISNFRSLGDEEILTELNKESILEGNNMIYSVRS